MLLLNILSLCLISRLVSSAPLAATKECTRAQLKELADGYLTAQKAGSAARLSTLSPSLAYTENFKSTSLNTSILSKPLKIDYSRTIFDTTQCATYTEIIVTDPSHPYVLGIQIHYTSGQISQISSLVSDQGDWLFNATGTLRYASQEDWFEIPEDERDNREVIQAAGDAYLDLFNDKSVVVPWGTPCARLEGGSYTGRGLPTDSCNVGVPSGLALVNRRYVVDEVLGAVDIFLNFGGARGSPDSHEFRVEKGKLRYVHTITIMK